MRFIFSFVAALFASSAVAQVQPAWWTPHVMPGGSSDVGRLTAVDAAGNVFTVGHRVLPPGSFSNLTVLKHSPSGAQMWAVDIDVLPLDEIPSVCALSPSGGLYVCGQSPFVNPSPALFLVEIDANGTLLWMRTRLGTGNKILGSTLAIAANGDLLLAGTLGNGSVDWDGVVERYTSNGALVWSRTLDAGVGAHDYAVSLRVDPSGAILVGGMTEKSGDRDMAVWKLASNGSTIWLRTFGGPLDDSGTAIELSPAGNVLAAGTRSTYSAAGADSEWLLVQLDLASGELDWRRTQDDGSTLSDSTVDVARDAKGVWWIAGERVHPGGSRAAVVQRIDPNGTLLSTHLWSIAPGDNGTGYVVTAPRHWLRGPAGQMWLTAISTVPDTFAQPLGYRCVVAQYGADGEFDWQGYMTALPGKRFDMFGRASFAPPAQIVFGGSSSDHATGLSHGFTGALDFMRMPHSYCTAKTTSNGCVPRIEIAGMPSAAATSGFNLRAREVRNLRNGMLFYGASGAQTVPFHGGTLCVAAPLLRSAVQMR